MPAFGEDITEHTDEEMLQAILENGRWTGLEDKLEIPKHVCPECGKATEAVHEPQEENSPWYSCEQCKKDFRIETIPSQISYKPFSDKRLELTQQSLTKALLEKGAALTT